VNRRRFVAGIVGLSLARSANAQPQMRRVAVVSVADVARPPLASLIQGLRELGYEAGRNLEIIPATHASYARLGEMAANAVKRDPEAIVTWGSTATRAAKAATWSIPIVMVVGIDPIEHGFVRTYARPDGNITGIAMSSHLLSVKRVELLKEVLPAVRRFGVLWSAESASQPITIKHIEAAAGRLGLNMHAVEVSDPRALKGAFAKFAEAGVEALLPISSAMLTRESAEIVRLAASHRIPTVYAGAAPVRSGGLISYGPDISAQFRHAAAFVDRILKGAKPAEMPIEQPTKFEMIVNLKTAKALGIEIPKSVLFRADEVIQ
jgi:putative ABC transport system substrate-binding protein